MVKRKKWHKMCNNEKLRELRQQKLLVHTLSVNLDRELAIVNFKFTKGSHFVILTIVHKFPQLSIQQ
jgi:hypothetical protein